MSTRLYFSQYFGTSTFGSYTKSSSWESGTAKNGILSKTKGSLAFSTANISATSSSTTYDVCIYQFLSQPLASQTISGTFKGMCRVLGTSSNNSYMQCIIRALTPSGTERGVLLSQTESSLSSQIATTATNRKFPMGWTGAGVNLSSISVYIRFSVKYRLSLKRVHYFFRIEAIVSFCSALVFVAGL
jgi:hypothetical protein